MTNRPDEQAIGSKQENPRKNEATPGAPSYDKEKTVADKSSANRK